MLDIHTIAAHTNDWNRLRKIAQWIAEKFMDLWHAHVQALEESESYRRQLVILTGAAITLLAIAGPIDTLIAAAVATYVAAHTRDHRSSWSNGSNRVSYYDEERW